MTIDNTIPYIPNEDAIYLVRVRQTEIVNAPRGRVYFVAELETLEASNPQHQHRVFKWLRCLSHGPAEIPEGSSWLQYPTEHVDPMGIADVRAFYEALGVTPEEYDVEVRAPRPQTMRAVDFPDATGREAWLLVRMRASKRGTPFAVTTWRKA